MEHRINSALALAKTKSIQAYHVFAYKINKNVDIEDDNPIFGSIIILASFGGNGMSDEEALQSAISYAKSLNKMSEYPLIFYTKTHNWFNLTKRPTIDTVHYIDDKSGLQNVKNFINKDIVDKFEKELEEKKEMEALIEEERKRVRKQNNPDNVEHYISSAQNIVRLNVEIEDMRKELEEKEKVLKEEKKKLREHYERHEKHEKDALVLLSLRMKKEEYDFFLLNYNKARDEILTGESKGDSETFYVKKGREKGSFWSSGSASLSERWVRKGEKGEKESEIEIGGEGEEGMRESEKDKGIGERESEGEKKKRKRNRKKRILEKDEEVNSEANKGEKGGE